MSSFVWTRLLPKAGFEAPITRSSHGVSLVRNGSRLIVYGGEHVARTPINRDQACWAAESLDGDDSIVTWRRIDSGPSDRIAHAQAVHDDKHVYVFGGRAGIGMDEQALNDLWMLDCSGESGSEAWSQVESTNPAPEPRSFHRMICIGDALYVFGGCGASHGRLADLHEFNVKTKTWKSLGSSKLRGRGGPNLMSIAGGTKLAVVAGFSGEETRDGDRFDLKEGQWEEMQLTAQLEEMRPRSVCVSASFPKHGVSVIFGGEVDPSDRGHEGAGGFTNDLCVLSETDAAYQKTILPPTDDESWPESRGWADSASVDGPTGLFYVFGGLTGDDDCPKRLNDLWRLEVKSSS